MNNRLAYASGCLSALVGLAFAPAHANITEYAVPTASSHPTSIIRGPDGNLWFIEVSSGKIGKITPLGVTTELDFSGKFIGYFTGITEGSDGNVWFTTSGCNACSPLWPVTIGKVTPAGALTQFPLLSTNTYPAGLASGPDRNLWFTLPSTHNIYKITPTGVITQLPGVTSYAHGIASGPDGNLWFTEYTALCATDFCTASNGMIGKITPAGAITEFPVPTSDSFLDGIASGPDGNLWFTESQGGTIDVGPAAGKIGKITPAGAIIEYTTPTAGSAPTGIVSGPDGNLWFTESKGNNIGKITPTGVITEYAVPTANSGPTGIAAGPDGNVWFTESATNQIGKIDVRIAADTQNVPVLGGKSLALLSVWMGIAGLLFVRRKRVRLSAD